MVGVGVVVVTWGHWCHGAFRTGQTVVIDFAVQGYQKGACKSGVGVIILEKALESFLKEGVFHSHAVGGALDAAGGALVIEVCSSGFGLQFTRAAGDGLGRVDLVEEFTYR